MSQSIRFFRSLPALAALLLAGCSSDSDTSIIADVITPDPATAMTFFLTSVGPGDGGNLGGLAGADVHCANLAEAAGTSGEEWRAYLSTTGADGINASERIGSGPWVNVDGVIVATDVENLLSDNNNITLETAITESGELVNGVGEVPLRHDILTGTELDGLASDRVTDSTCSNWTSNSTGNAIVGHHDRVGGGSNPMSWSSAHDSTGCSQADFKGTGGDGLFYCFAMK